MSENYPPGLVCVPHQDWIYTRPAISLQTVSHTLPRGTRWMWAGGNSTPITYKRNEAAQIVLDHPQFEWLLFLDSDQVYPEDLAVRLFSVDADIAAALVFMKRDHSNYAPCAGVVTHLSEEAPEERPADGDGFGFSVPNPLQVGEGLGTVEVDVVGSGCMLIRRRVLEAIPRPWFVANKLKNQGYNEDYNFCLRAKRAGFSVKVDTDLQVEHVGPEGITVDKAREHWREKLQVDPQEPFWPPLN